MTAFSSVIQLIAQKVDAIETKIEALEVQLRQMEAQEQVVNTTISNRSNLAIIRWLNKFLSPKAEFSAWHEDFSRIELQKLLASETIDTHILASLLNLYTLNAAIHLMRLKADKAMAQEVEELRQIAEQTHSINKQQTSVDNFRPGCFN